MSDRIKITYTYCLDYIKLKQDKFNLTLEDLLYVSNFKGGGGTIQESPLALKEKLKYFSEKFSDIDKHFGGKSLYQLSENELQEFSVMCDRVLLDCHHGSCHKIAGIGVSYMSALLHVYFQNLCPIIDRNILLGLNIIEKTLIDSQGQVKNIHLFYKTLIHKIYLLQKNDTSKNLKDIDDIYFELGKIKWKN